MPVETGEADAAVRRDAPDAAAELVLERVGDPPGACEEAGGTAADADRRERALEAQMPVVRGGPVDHRVPRAGRRADRLDRADRQIAVLVLDGLEDPQHLLRVVVVAVEDRDDGVDRDRLEVLVGPVGNRATRATQRGLLTPLAVRLRRAPVNVEASLGVDPAHVDALDRARLGALEARLALQRPVLVVQQLEPTAVLGRVIGLDLGVLDRRLRLEEPPQGQRHPAEHPEAGYKAHVTTPGPTSRRRSRPRSRTG